MAITSTSAVGTDTAATAAATGTTGTSNADSEKRFLKLLVTQLNNQDPLNPMDNAELTSQLAQMSTVSGIEQLNATLSGLVSQTGSNQVLQAASLIGYAVLSPGNTLSLEMVKDETTGVEAPREVPFAVELPASGATDVTVTITDANGNKVRTMQLGALPEGSNGAKWDGKNDAGEVVAEGNYQFTVAATGAGTTVKAEALTFTQVSAVKQGANGVTLDLSTGKSISLSDVRMFL